MLQTDNLKLALYEPTDLANLTDGYNESMQILDDANQTINLLVTQEATRAKAKEAELLQAIGNETTRAEAEEKAIHEMVADYDTLIKNNTDNITKNASAIKDIENKLETGDGTVYAPINHASAETTYGVATDTQYGHVKLANVYSPTGANDIALSTTGFLDYKNNRSTVTLRQTISGGGSYQISVNKALGLYNLRYQFQIDAGALAASSDKVILANNLPDEFTPATTREITHGCLLIQLTPGSESELKYIASKSLYIGNDNTIYMSKGSFLSTSYFSRIEGQLLLLCSDWGLPD